MCVFLCVIDTHILYEKERALWNLHIINSHRNKRWMSYDFEESLGYRSMNSIARFWVIGEIVFELVGWRKEGTQSERFEIVLEIVKIDKRDSVDGYLKIWSWRVGFYFISVERSLNMELIDKKESFRNIDLALRNGLYKYL